jgi:D-beta-D-heptose 7-phosphate kinase/D-beta-D-heptose 1-phosphate adenosyltransferase
VNFDLLHQLKSVKVLVIGDIMLDHYIWGDVQRISPEAPVPVVHVNRDTYTAGGAANVALNLAHLGIQTTILGHCANDDAGSKLSEIFRENNIRQVIPVLQSPVPTIIKTRVIIRGQQLCRIDRESSREKYNVEQHENFESLLADAVANADAVIISDYAKGVITQSLIDKLLENPRHKDGSLLIAVDPKPSRRLNYHGVGLLTPNRNEALELAEFPPLHSEEAYPLNEICEAIESKFNPRLLVVTLGAEGMAICNDGKVVNKLPTEARQVFDVSGAGDTVIALLTASLAAGASPFEAATLANIAAGIVVSHMGTAPITYDELNEAIQHFKTNQKD